jgi:integrase
MSISCNDVIILAPTNALISIRGRPYDSVLQATRLPACAPLNFNAGAGTITIRESKSGKPHRVRSHKGRTFFAELTAGRTGRELVVLHDDGKAFEPSHQQRPMDAASARATVEPAATFHILRHTYASALAMKGVQMGVIAAQLRHADTRMTERHYAHLSPGYVADTIRAALPALGIVEKANVRT